MVLFIKARKSNDQGTSKLLAGIILGLFGLEILLGIILTYFGMPPFAQPLHLFIGAMLFGVLYIMFLLVRKGKVIV